MLVASRTKKPAYLTIVPPAISGCTQIALPCPVRSNVHLIISTLSFLSVPVISQRFIPVQNVLRYLLKGSEGKELYLLLCRLPIFCPCSLCHINIACRVSRVRRSLSVESYFLLLLAQSSLYFFLDFSFPFSWR